MCFHLAVSNQLRRFRQRRLLTQQELAALVGVGHTCISNIELGRSAGHWRTRKRLARVLAVSETSLFPD